MIASRQLSPVLKVFSLITALAVAAALVGCTGAPRSVYGGLNSGGGNSGGNSGYYNSNGGGNGGSPNWDPGDPSYCSNGGCTQWSGSNGTYTAMDSERCNQIWKEIQLSNQPSGDNTYYGGWTGGRTGWALSADKVNSTSLAAAQHAVDGAGNFLPLYPSYGGLQQDPNSPVGYSPQLPNGPTPWQYYGGGAPYNSSDQTGSQSAIADLSISPFQTIPWGYILIAYCIASCVHPDQLVTTASQAGLPYDPSAPQVSMGTLKNNYYNGVHSGQIPHQYVYSLTANSAMGAINLVSAEAVQFFGLPQDNAAAELYYTFYTIDGSSIEVTDKHPMITGDGSVYTARDLAKLYDDWKNQVVDASGNFVSPDAPTLLKADGSTPAINAYTTQWDTATAANLITSGTHTVGETWTVGSVKQNTFVAQGFVVGDKYLQDDLANESIVDADGNVMPSLAAVTKLNDGQNIDLYIPDLFQN